MPSVIYIDPAAILPVIGKVWHRTRLSGIPAPGQGITMLCGETAIAAFEVLDQRRVHGAPTQCPFCDVVYRRSLGWAIPERHPGLQPRPRRPRP